MQRDQTPGFYPAQHSLLAGQTSAALVMEPYPHIIINNALPRDYYQALEAHYPSIDALKQVVRAAKRAHPQSQTYARTLRHLGRRNRRVNIASTVVTNNSILSPMWQEFINYHSSNAFFHEMVEVFRPAISRSYPEFDPTQAYAAHRGSSETKDITIESMIAMNTPSWFRGKITGPHTDHPKKLFVGLFYMRDPRDTAGGDLILYKRKQLVTAENLKWQRPNTVEAVNTVHYQANTLVVLLNSPQAVHGVTLRKASKYPRRFVNIIAERSKPFFRV